jgi:hypothetical protein
MVLLRPYKALGPGIRAGSLTGAKTSVSHKVHDRVSLMDTISATRAERT